MASLSQAIAEGVTRIDSHTYSTKMSDKWVIGTVPHGGFTSALLLAVTRHHFAVTLESYNQPDPIILHLEFLRRTSVGDALVKIVDKKLGRRTSSIQVTLIQSDVEKVVGFVTHTNLSSESGISLATHWSLHPSPLPMDTAKLADDSDPNWQLATDLPFPEFRKATRNVDIYRPRVKSSRSAIVDEWIRMKNKEPFSFESLGFVNDMFPQLVETFDTEHEKQSFGKNWYPTLVMNLEIKKALPEGAEFLFVRVLAHRILHGRMDLQVTILDESGELVAVGSHTSLILSASRNLASRNQSATGGGAEEKKGASRL